MKKILVLLFITTFLLLVANTNKVFACAGTSQSCYENAQGDCVGCSSGEYCEAGRTCEVYVVSNPNPTPVPINPGTPQITTAPGQPTLTPVPTGESKYVSACTIDCSGTICNQNADGERVCTTPGTKCEAGCYCVPQGWGCGTDRWAKVVINSFGLVDPNRNYTTANAYATNLSYSASNDGGCSYQEQTTTTIYKTTPSGSEIAIVNKDTLNKSDIPVNWTSGTFGLGADGNYGSDPNNMQLCLKVKTRVVCPRYQDPETHALSGEAYVLKAESTVACVTKQYTCDVDSLQ